jgi:hypothetical protein
MFNGTLCLLRMYSVVSALHRQLEDLMQDRHLVVCSGQAAMPPTFLRRQEKNESYPNEPSRLSFRPGPVQINTSIVKKWESHPRTPETPPKQFAKRYLTSFYLPNQR